MMHESSVMPIPIVVALKEYEREAGPSMRQLLRLIDAYEVIVKYCAIIAIQNFYNAALQDQYPEIHHRINEIISRPSLGHWLELFRETVRALEASNATLICPPLKNALYGRHFQQHCDTLSGLRNRYVGHGATLRDDEAGVLARQHEPALLALLGLVSFLGEYPLLYVEERLGDGSYCVCQLSGSDYANVTREILTLHDGIAPLSPDHVVLTNSEKTAFLDLHPLILYKECTDSIAGQLCRQYKVMFYNEIRDDAERIAYLDYWRGHHSRFRQPYSALHEEFRSRFPRPQRALNGIEWFTEYIHETTTHFVGREQELQQIGRFIEESPKKVLVVVSPPGMGKSTLLARWADEHQAVRHFIRQGDAKTYEPIYIFENLSRQISTKFGVPWQVPQQRDPKLYRDAFDTVLISAAQKGRVVVIIDGLDEAVRSVKREVAQKDTLTIIDWLPAPELLPENACLILSTRPELLEQSAFSAKYAEDKAQHLFLSRLSDAEIRALLYQVRSKYEVLEREDYVQALVERSEGNPLYLRMLLEDIQEGRIPFGDIPTLPQGVIAYFERILEYIEGEGRMRDMPNIELLLQEKRKTLETLVQEGHITPEVAARYLERERVALEGRASVKSVELLALYCLAKEPLSLVEAAAMLNAPAEEVHRAFEIIRTVLISGENKRFSLFHSAFREYVLNLSEYTEDGLHRHEATISEALSKMLSYCARWADHKNPYALRHYATHLYEAGVYDTLYAIARDEAFLKAQNDTVPAEPELPLRTLQTALNAAIKRQEAPLIAEMLLRHAKYATDFETPIDVLEQGDIERALSLAEVMMERNDALGILWLLLLAWSLHQTGNATGAEQCFQEFLAWGEKKTLEKPEYWRGDLSVFLLSELGYLSNASAVAVRVLTDEKQVELVSRWAYAGWIEQSLHVAQQISRENERVWTLGVIADAIAQTGKREATLIERLEQQALLIDDAASRVKVLAAAARTMAQLGLLTKAQDTFQHALQIVSQITADFSRRDALLAIARALAQAKIDDTSLWRALVSNAQQIETPEDRSEVLVEIARAMAQVKLLSDAYEILMQAQRVAQLIEYDSSFAEKMAAIGQVFAEWGQSKQAQNVIRKALETAQRIDSLSIYISVLKKIAQALTKVAILDSAHWDLITQAVQQIGWEDSRAAAFASIARVISQTNCHDLAQRMLQQALETIREIEETDDMGEVVEEIAHAMAQIGINDKTKWLHVVDIASSIASSKYRAEALKAIAQAVAQVNISDTDLWHALVDSASRIRDTYDCHSALVEIVRGMAQTNQFEHAFRITEYIDNFFCRAEALFRIAQHVTAEQAQDVLQLVLHILYDAEIDETTEDSVFLIIIEALAQVGKLAESFERALRIKDHFQRSMALASVATLSVQRGDHEKARFAITQAMHAIQQIRRSSDRQWALANVAEAVVQIKINDTKLWGTLTEYARQIEIPEDRSQSLATIAEQMAKIGLLDDAQDTLYQALQVARFIEDEYDYKYTLEAIVQAMAQAKVDNTVLWRVLIENIQRIEDEDNRGETLSETAQAMARVHITDAHLWRTLFRTARSLEDEYTRTAILSTIAQAAAQVGRFTQALSTALGLPTWYRSDVLISIAQSTAYSLAQAGRFPSALRVAALIKEERARTETLIEIAQVMTQLGLFEEAKEALHLALETAQYLVLDQDREETCVKIAQTLRKAKINSRSEWDRLIQIAQKISQLIIRANSLAKIAREMEETGLKGAARLVLQTALQEASFEGSTCCWTVIEEAAQLGLDEIVLEYSRRILSNRDTGLSRVLYLLAQRGAKGTFLELIPLCAWSFTTALHACAGLIRLYPDDAEAIAAQVIMQLESSSSLLE